MIEFDTPLPAAMTDGAFSPGVVDENAAYGLSRGSEEMRSVFEFRIFLANQPQPSLVHQCCGLEGLAGRFVSHLVRCQFAQLLIDQREQFVGSVGIALLDGSQDMS